MPRIRTIKPSFFQNDELAELSPHARLLYIALWTIADCEGRLEDNPKRIKPQSLPYEEVDINALLEELSPKFVTRYEVQGLRLLQILGFLDHQRLSGKEAQEKSLLPPPNGQVKQSGSIGEEDCLQERKGKEGNTEGKGREGKRFPDSSPQDLITAWNELRGKLPQAIELSHDRKEKCRTRLSERPLEKWRETFSIIAKTPFLNGKNDRKWRATFDWIISNSDNSLKVLEGKYNSDAETEREAGRDRTQDNRAAKEIWKASRLSTCHGKKLIEGKPGEFVCDQCLTPQPWAAKPGLVVV